MALPFRPPDREDERVAGYWNGFEHREIRLPQCRDCEAFHWHPKYLCPDCGSERIAWTAVSGEATLFTWVGVEYHFHLPFLREEVPFETGLVCPVEDESIRLVAAIRTPDDVSPEIGMELKATFIDGSEGTPVPVYEPQ
jgi:hypothetical protein